MNRMNRDNVLGYLLGGTVGDAMGAATEVRAMEQIKEQFDGYVGEFFTPPEDTFAHSCKRGQITDNFSIAYMNCVEIVNNHGIIDEETAKKALLKWYEVPEFKRFTGPTTKAAVQVPAEETPMDTGQKAFIPTVGSGRGTNGAAMKTTPIVLFGGNNIELAIRNTVKLCGVTRNSNIALSEACVIAAATAQALHEGMTLNEIIDAGMYGAAQGDQLSRASGKTTCGPFIERRIKKATELSILVKDMEEVLTLIEDYIGSGLTAAEAVSTIFGLIAASRGGLLEALFTGVNIGDDTDTVTTMIGGIMGAYREVSSFPDEYLTIIKGNNRIDIKGLAEQTEELWKGRQEYV